MTDEVCYTEVYDPPWALLASQIDPPKLEQLQRVQVRFGLYGSITSADLRSLLTDANSNGFYECSFCDKVFLTRNTAAGDHIAIAHLSRILTCVRCEQTFGRAYDVRQHFRVTHTQERRAGFRCSQCDLTFTKRFNLNRHSRVTHPPV